MHDIPELVDGYNNFLTNKYPAQADLYRSLAETGQKPKTMIIACCDSRADPAVIFSAGPGEIFVVRNVANLVPPHEPDGDYHGTSSALEFAVEGIEVETILVMGHARCSGINAFLAGLYEPVDEPGFIDRWMSLLNPARTEALRDIHDAPIERQQEALEHAAIRHSIENLKTFPCIKERVADGRLILRGAYFDIADGTMLALDPDSGKFVPLD
jgi:carbonic anhydrase